MEVGWERFVCSSEAGRGGNGWRISDSLCFLVFAVIIGAKALELGGNQVSPSKWSGERISVHKMPIMVLTMP